MSFIIRTMIRNIIHIFEIPDNINISLILKYLKIIYPTFNFSQTSTCINQNTISFIKNPSIYRVHHNNYISQDMFLLKDDILKIDEVIFNELNKLWYLDKTYTELKNMTLVKDLIL